MHASLLPHAVAAAAAACVYCISASNYFQPCSLQAAKAAGMAVYSFAEFLELGRTNPAPACAPMLGYCVSQQCVHGICLMYGGVVVPP